MWLGFWSVCVLTETVGSDAAMLRHGNWMKIALSSRSSQVSARRLRAAVHIRGYSSEPEPSQDVAILGGGITGLASAYYITRELPKAKVTIYEASDRVGGWLSSRRVPVKDGSVLFEAGPRTLRPSSNGVLAARLV